MHQPMSRDLTKPQKEGKKMTSHESKKIKTKKYEFSFQKCAIVYITQIHRDTQIHKDRDRDRDKGRDKGRDRGRCCSCN